MCGWTTLVYPFICDGHLSCFFLSVVNIAAMNICGKFLYEHRFSFFLGSKYLEVELPGHMVTPCLPS